MGDDDRKQGPKPGDPCRICGRPMVEKEVSGGPISEAFEPVTKFVTCPHCG